ncbi:MAG: L,D-transpeptidase family protein [Micavibrio sp.]
MVSSSVFTTAAAMAVTLLLVAMPVSAGAQTYQKDYIGKAQTYRAKFEDTLVHLAREHNLGFVEMRAANPRLDPWLPGEGAKVILPTRHILPDAPREGIVINLAEMRLYYFPAGTAAEPPSYPISPGREGLRTPVGTTTIQRKVVGPTWRPTARMRSEDPTLPAAFPPGPDNPLGTHALYLGWPEYLIHGTNKPYAIGRMASSGCIRMYPESVRDLYPRVPNGTRVTVVDQPVKVGWIDDKMYVEVSPTQEQSKLIENLGELSSYEITADDMKRITAKAGGLADNIDWDAVRKAVREHRGYPVPVLERGGVKGAKVIDEMDDEAPQEVSAAHNGKAAQAVQEAGPAERNAPQDAGDAKAGAKEQKRPDAPVAKKMSEEAPAPRRAITLNP